MPLVVLCPKCGARYQVADGQAGRTGTCPTCGTVARIPAIGSSPDTAGSAGAEGAYSAYRSPQFPADSPAYGDWARRREEAAARLRVHLILVGVFNLVVGGVSILWALLMVLEAFMFSSGEIPLDPSGPPEEFMVGFCAVIAVLSFGTAMIQIAAGIAILRRWPRCRTLGIISGVVGCVSAWECCAFFFSVATGVYSLVILCSRDARDALEG